jgi:hypothetical protein
VVTTTGTGTVTVYADQGGDSNWLPAPPLSAAVTVVYRFVGFTSPVDNLPVLNRANAGQTVPLKWRLLDASGHPVTHLTLATVRVTSITCLSGLPVDTIDEYAAGESGLQNLGDGYYQYNWATPKSYAGTCRTVHLNLGEGGGITHDAQFQFRN